MAQARDKPQPDRVHDTHKDDRHRRGRLPGRQSRWPSRSQDDIDLQADQLLGQLRKLVDAAVGGSEFHNHILAIDISPLAQALLKAVEVALGRLAPPQEPNPVDLSCPMILRASWREDNGNEA